MNKNIFCALIFALVSLVFVAGCGSETTMTGSCSVEDHEDGTATMTCADGTSAELGSSGGECGAPPSTSLMQYEWNQAEMFRRDCRFETDFQYQFCLEQGQENCQEYREQSEYACRRIHALWSNMLPLRECGAEIFVFDDVEDPESDWTVSLDDPDGDGINNWWEYLMGLNPCEAESFGSCVPSDTELDYDADGIPNGEDEHPLCGDVTDPSTWQSDCV